MGPPLLWMLAVPAVVLISIAELFSPEMKAVQKKIGTAGLIGIVVAQTILGGSALYALIRYAYFSPRLST